MIGSRHRYTATNRDATTARLPAHATKRGQLLGLPRTTGGTSGAGGVTTIGVATGGGSGSTCAVAGGSVTGAHFTPQRAQRTSRPAATSPGTSYSAVQEGHVMNTVRLCKTTSLLATEQASLG